MKLIKITGVLLAMVLVMSGCVQQDITEEDNGQKEEGTTGTLSVITMTEDAEGTTTEEVIATETTTTEVTAEDSTIPGVDYDLTSMSKDMVYATIYQVMYEPDKYVGKVFRVQGPYYPVYVDETGKYYHYCLIQDAAACCTQGMEFVWEDGSHIYPDEYPAENTEITVQGTFEIYTEDEDSSFVYFRLNPATLEW